MDRSFIVHTPLGKLRVYAKHDVDCAEDFPGVFVDLIKNDADEYGEILCCVEYDSRHKQIQTVAYQPHKDDPVAIVTHVIEKE